MRQPWRSTPGCVHSLGCATHHFLVLVSEAALGPCPDCRMKKRRGKRGKRGPRQRRKKKSQLAAYSSCRYMARVPRQRQGWALQLATVSWHMVRGQWPTAAQCPLLLLTACLVLLQVRRQRGAPWGLACQWMIPLRCAAPCSRGALFFWPGRCPGSLSCWSSGACTGQRLPGVACPSAPVRHAGRYRDACSGIQADLAPCGPGWH